MVQIKIESLSGNLPPLPCEHATPLCSMVCYHKTPYHYEIELTTFKVDHLLSMCARVRRVDCFLLFGCFVLRHR